MSLTETVTQTAGHSPANDGAPTIAAMRSHSAPVATRHKPSRFNAHTTTADNRMLLYNAFSGQMCSIPAEHVAKAKQYLRNAVHEGVLCRLGEYLKAKGYIIDAEVDEGSRWDVRYGLEQFRQDRLELILLPSEDCNFRCVYCSQQFKRGTMRPGVRAGVKRLVESHIRRLRTLQVSWFGGEPLLGFDVIEEIAPHMKDLSEKFDVAYSSSMTTNAFLLKRDWARKLLSWGVTRYQITIDGLALEHDAHRPLQGGGQTFHQIIANLYAMKELPDPFKVAIRCNFDRTNTKAIIKLMTSLKDLVADDNRFNFRFRPIGKWGGPNDDDLQTCGLKEASERMLEFKSYAITSGMATDKPAEGMKPGAASVCYAARPYNLIIGADGKIMKCTVVLDTEARNVVGELFEDGSVSLDQDRFGMWTPPYYHEDKMCSKCFFVPVCQGVSCPLPRVVAGTRECPSQKQNIRQTLLNVDALTRLRSGDQAPRSGEGGEAAPPEGS